MLIINLLFQAAVPAEQRPVNELGQLREGQLYSWVSANLSQYNFKTSTPTQGRMEPEHCIQVPAAA